MRKMEFGFCLITFGGCVCVSVYLCLGRAVIYYLSFQNNLYGRKYADEEPEMGVNLLGQ